MSLYNKSISQAVLVLLLLPLTFGSCLKKIEGVDGLNTNIFDREYTGEQWYVINSIEQVTNELGQIKARISLTIPDENVPELKPSNIKLEVEGDGLEPVIKDFPRSGDGDYNGIVDLPYDGVKTYCITLGIYILEENGSINSFEDCIAL